MHFFKWFTRVIVATVFFAVAIFCLFGFLAAYEPSEATGLRVVYALVGMLCAVGGVVSTIQRWSFDESKGPEMERSSKPS